MKRRYKKIIGYTAIIVLVCIIAFLILGDSVSVENLHAGKLTDRCEIEYTGNKLFKLDDETSYLSAYVQLVDKDSSCYLTFLNEYNNSIYFYDFKTSAFVKRIKYDKEGNNGVGQIQGYYYINEDSIFVYEYGGHRLFLTDSESSVIHSPAMLFTQKKAQQVEDITSFPPAPYAQTDNPIRMIKDNVILGGFISGEYLAENSRNRPVNILYDLTKEEVRYINNYPDMYQKYNWGGGLAYRLPHFDTNEDNILLSFSADHYIVNYSFSADSCTRHYAGSSLINKITSFSYPKSIPLNKERVMGWYRENPSYEGIYYDKYKNLYYRIARLPNLNYKKGEWGNRKPVVVIVLDSDLNYLGEETLPSALNLRTTNCFVSEDGFYIQLLDDNENCFSFCKFEININSTRRK